MIMPSLTPDELLEELNKELTILEEAKRKEMLINYINSLLLDDFDKLIYLLYRADVDEMKLKSELAQKKDLDASIIIAELLLQRASEKAQARMAGKKENGIS